MRGKIFLIHLTALPAAFGQSPQQPSVTPTNIPSMAKVLPTVSLLNARKEFEIGSTLPLSGGVAMIGKDFTYGLNLIFNSWNRDAGPDGIQIRLSSLDDLYDNSVATRNIRALREKSPFFIGLFGTQTALSTRPFIKDHEMVSLFPLSGCSTLRSEELRYVVHFRPSMESEIKTLVQYAVEQLYRRKIAVFYEDDPWGDEGLLAVQKALEPYGLNVIAQGSYPQSTVNIMPAVQAITREAPTAIVCIAQARPAYNFIQSVINQGYQNCLFLGLRELTLIGPLIKKSRGVAIVTTSVVPNPFQSKLPIVQEYRDNMQKFLPNLQLSAFSLEGYVIATILTESLKRCKADMTLEKLLVDLESTATNLKGIDLTFTPSTRTLSNTVWINDGENRDWISYRQ